MLTVLELVTLSTPDYAEFPFEFCNVAVVISLPNYLDGARQSQSVIDYLKSIQKNKKFRVEVQDSIYLMLLQNNLAGSKIEYSKIAFQLANGARFRKRRLKDDKMRTEDQISLTNLFEWDINDTKAQDLISRITEKINIINKRIYDYNWIRLPPKTQDEIISKDRGLRLVILIDKFRI